MIASVSGIRGVLNEDVSLVELARFASNFVSDAGASDVLVARDTRSTGPAIAKAVAAAVMSRGVSVIDYGVLSTPALFRESRVLKKPGIIVTASHNEPEFNGLKFLVDGAGAAAEVVEAAVKGTKSVGRGFRAGSLIRRPRASYNNELVKRFGEGTCKGVKVGLDLGGGAAIFHAVPILQRLGCEVRPINGTPGIFNRRVDPMSDDLLALRGLVSSADCDVGFAFDCDGDRLCIVDDSGAKRSGDFMLTLALSRMLKQAKEKTVVVSQDTTIAVDEVAAKLGWRVFRSKVGEANVVAMMQEKGAEIGGEGSSGGLIDRTFNSCRDSMLAALLIVGGLKEAGHRFYSGVKAYHQERDVVKVPRRKMQGVVKALAQANKNADTTDGVKVWLSKKSWVLVRPSNTEDVMRISAEAETLAEARKTLDRYRERIRELSR